MGCFPGLPLTVEGLGPVVGVNEGLGANDGLGANEGVDESTSVEGGADEATSPSMKSSGQSAPPPLVPPLAPPHPTATAAPHLTMQVTRPPPSTWTIHQYCPSKWHPHRVISPPASSTVEDCSGHTPSHSGVGNPTCKRVIKRFNES